MRFKMVLPAGENERFAPDAFANSVGTSFPLHTMDDLEVPATLIDAQVRDDRGSVELTVETEADIDLRRTWGIPEGVEIEVADG